EGAAGDQAAAQLAGPEHPRAARAVEARGGVDRGRLCAARPDPGKVRGACRPGLAGASGSALARQSRERATTGRAADLACAQVQLGGARVVDLVAGGADAPGGALEITGPAIA